MHWHKKNDKNNNDVFMNLKTIEVKKTSNHSSIAMQCFGQFQYDTCFSIICFSVSKI